MKEIADPDDLKDGNKYVLDGGLLKTTTRLIKKDDGYDFEKFPIFILWNVNTHSPILVSLSKKGILDEIILSCLRIYETGDDN